MSLFGFWARRCRKWLLWIVAVMAAVETVLFVWAIYRSMEGHLEQIITNSGMPLVAACAFFSLTSALYTIGTDRGAQSSYTLRRLALSERRAFFCRAAHNTLCYIVLWGAQLAVALGFCLLWKQMLPKLWGTQTVLLAFYRVPFLHNLLPLGDWYLYPRNLLWFTAIGCATAREKRGMLTAMSIMTFHVFRIEMGSVPGLAVIDMALALLCIVWCTIYPGGAEEDTEKEAVANGTKA
ncbi:MAG: hypothetical protein E7425_07715 [Ruminococcaceae bacterium]|nr:hypothetical protein [Oscillospiraceae bacterium]